MYTWHKKYKHLDFCLIAGQLQLWIKMPKQTQNLLPLPCPVIYLGFLKAVSV